MKFSRYVCLAFAATALMSLPVAAESLKDTEKIEPVVIESFDSVSDNMAVADVGATQVEVTPFSAAAKLQTYALAGRKDDQPVFFADLTRQRVQPISQRDYLNVDPFSALLPALPEVGADAGFISDDGNFVSPLKIS